MISTFKVPEDQVQEFLTRWSVTTSVHAWTDGFIETHLHRNVGAGIYIQRINIMVWAPSETFLHEYEKCAAGEEPIPRIEFHPAVYEEIIMPTNLLPKSSSGQEWLTTKSVFVER